MASIKVKFRPSGKSNQEGTVYYQIIHERKVRQLLSDYRIFSYEWDNNRSTVVTTRESKRRSFIDSIRNRILWDVERLTKIYRRMDANGVSYTADDLIDEFHRYAREYTLFNFMEGVIATHVNNGKVRTSETYRSALNSFKKFREDEDIMLDCLTSELMKAYEAWLQNRGIALNTISFYARILRAVYNRAVEGGIIENRNPFRHVYTGVGKTVKRALPIKFLKRIKALDLSVTPSLEFARDMFMMSLYLRGMSLVDMAYLKKTDLKNGYVSYRRRKTGQLLIIKWMREMQMILDKYPDNGNVYLLPIIRTPGVNERCAYRNAGYNINRNLKIIGLMVGITVPLTLYVARHSWASLAKAKGIPLSVISEGMGHDSEHTTRIYLASLDTSAVDKANALILKSI